MSESAIYLNRRERYKAGDDAEGILLSTEQTVPRTVCSTVLLRKTGSRFESLPRDKNNRRAPYGALRLLARWKGFEPPTFWFVAKHSIQLSYQRIFETMPIIA